MVRLLVIVLTVIFACAASAGAAAPASTRTRSTLHVAAASDLVYCLEALNAAFVETERHVDLKVSTGSSGNFFAQIQHGAPYDVFLSADLRYPRALIEAGLADGDSLTLYAIGRIVLWTVTPDLRLEAGVAVVREARVKRFAIANPEHAPYGRAAREALENASAWTAAQPKLVLGENISQAAQFVHSGNADAGVVALSLVLSPRLRGVGRYAEIPASAHRPLEQGAVLTRKGAANAVAGRYLAFLRSPEARAIFDRYGFLLPDDGGPARD
jgi:molybdate transport system substrate-binding protein